jgi:hypothetical protein
MGPAVACSSPLDLVEATSSSFFSAEICLLPSRRQSGPQIRRRQVTPSSSLLLLIAVVRQLPSLSFLCRCRRLAGRVGPAASAYRAEAEGMAYAHRATARGARWWLVARGRDTNGVVRRRQGILFLFFEWVIRDCHGVRLLFSF